MRTLVLPPLPYGLTNYTDGFAGRVTLRPGTLWSLVEDVVESLEQQGVERVLLVNGHLEPEHVAVLRNLCVDRPTHAEGRAQIVLADVTRRAAAATLGAEFQSGDCHAGRYESSIVLAAEPALVDEPARAALPEVPISLSQQLTAGVTTFAAMGMDRAYAGAPAAATAAEGEAQLARLAEMIVAEITEALRS